jgi:NhaA family Na+:H+ antiporter
MHERIGFGYNEVLEQSWAGPRETSVLVKVSRFMSRLPIASARDWRATRLATILSPIERFIHSATSGGIVLIVATIAAMILANTALSGLYYDVLERYAGISFGDFTLKKSVLHWINDGLMVLFFFVVGLELKREALVGELASPRHAILPVVAAIGGALVPASMYIALNASGPGADGWGVPMATDIAFALGVLALLGNRVPFGLKVFLTAVAVIDDLLAVLVIALFYSGSIDTGALGIGLAVLVLLALINAAGIRLTAVYLFLGIIVWLAFLQSGVHATIAGVLVAFTIPARNRIDPDAFRDRLRGLLDAFDQTEPGAARIIVDERQASVVSEIEAAAYAVQTPLEKIQHALHPWVAFLIVPVFALANAGVTLSPAALSNGTPIVLGVMLGLVIGKPIGITLATFLLVRSGIASLPRGVNWSQIVAVGVLAGIGFTMSLFIATLGFGSGAQLEAAKIGILGASLIAGCLGYVLLWRATRAAPSA